MRNLITLKQAAELLSVCERTIRRQVEAGNLTGYRIGTKTFRLDAAEVEALAQPIPRGESA